LQGTRLGERPRLWGLLQNHMAIRVSEAKGTAQLPVSQREVSESEGTHRRICISRNYGSGKVIG
jgi:hypothetical protein